MKKTLTAFVLGLCCVSAYAYEGHGFRILSRTETSSPGTIGHFVPKTAKKKHLMLQDETQNMQLQKHKTLPQK